LDFVVKSGKADVPIDGTTSTLFVNLTVNNLMEYVNKRRYKIIKTKTVKITSTNLVTVGGITLFLRSTIANFGVVSVAAEGALSQTVGVDDHRRGRRHIQLS
jgi:hypothetical protein